MPTEQLGRPGISSVRLRAVRRLRFIDGLNHSLTSIEFEAPPRSGILSVLYGALHARKVCIVESATRITNSSIYQRFDLEELDGSPVVGLRREEVVMLFLEALAQCVDETTNNALGA